jgi:hypothetical protein
MIAKWFEADGSPYETEGNEVIQAVINTKDTEDNKDSKDTNNMDM